MARFNKVKNFAGKSYVVSNEIESLITSLSFDNNILKFGATTIGGDSVELGNGVDFSTWIEAAKNDATAAVIGTAEDTKDSDTIKGAKLYAKSVADEISAAAIGVQAGDGIKINVDGTTNVISTDIKLVAATTTADGAIATYELQVKEAGKDTYKSVGSINIPKDMVATKGELVDRKDGETTVTGTYIKMTVANGAAFYINVADLIEYNSYANSDTISSEAVGGKAHQYKFNVVDGSITTAKIADANVTTAKIADANVTAVKLSADVKTLFDAAGVADQALTDAKAYTDAEIDKLDGSAVIATVAGDVVTLKAGITETDGIVDQSAGDDIVLAKVAKTGAAADVSVADTENVITATNVEGALVEIAKEIDAMDATTAADATTEDATAIQGVQVVKSITQVDGKLTEIATAKADKFGSANKALADAKTYTDKVIAAVNATAVQFMSAELTLSATTTFGTVDGRVIAVYGADGVQVYPEITFASNVSTIKAEGLTEEEKFTVIYATTITVANN